MKELKDVINDNFLFEEIQSVNMYLNEQILKKWIDAKSKHVQKVDRNIFTF